MKLRNLVVGTAVLGLATAGSVFGADGAAVFKAKCATCHGEAGLADTPAGKSMKAAVLAGNAKIAALSDADIIAKVKENKKHAALKSLADDDLAAAVGQVKKLAAGK